jgi:hypothetical protein
MYNDIALLMIIDICIAFSSMRLPSYVLLEIINFTLFFNHSLKHKRIIDHIICINEWKRRKEKQSLIKN